MALLNEINVKGVPHPIVTDDGYYQEMTVGDAEQLVSSMYVEDSEPYGYRTTGGSADVGNRAYLDKIVGGTVVWNQHLESYTYTGASVSVDGDVITITPKNSLNRYLAKEGNDDVLVIQNHVYLQSVVIKSDGEHPAGFQNYRYLVCTNKTTSATWTVLTQIAKASSSGKSVVQLFSADSTEYQIKKDSFNLFDITQMFGSTIADYIYSIEQANAGAGVAWFKKLFPKDYYEYNAGELLSVEGLQSHDTVGFNQFDIATNKAKLLGGYQYEIVGAYTSVSYEDASGNVETLTITNRLFTPTNNGTLTVVGADDTTCVHLVWLGYRNGEYEPYEKHSYPLDSSLTLRGIPKLDASNNLYYDGDEYTSDGKVKRKYGVVDLGSLDYYVVDSRFNTKAPIAGTGSSGLNIITPRYVTSGLAISREYDKSICVNPNGYLFIYDTSYTDAATFKEAMSGVMLVYELATPTTETAEPFQNIQIMDDFGTEDFVSTGIVPVGHNTRYPANLRDKIQHLPSLASADGTYLIQQSGKQMSLIHMPAVFPDTPTEDGTYVLKATVSGGTPTYVWEGVNAKSEGE